MSKDKKNDKRGYCLYWNKTCWYSYSGVDGRVVRADGRIVGNYIAGDFLLTHPDDNPST